jgi:DNA-binding response OmpR family regulator
MPEMDGYDLCARLQQNPHLSYIPVIFLTARSGEETEVKALELAAVDFIRKPFKKEILLLRVKSALKS